MEAQHVSRLECMLGLEHQVVYSITLLLGNVLSLQLQILDLFMCKSVSADFNL